MTVSFSKRPHVVIYDGLVTQTRYERADGVTVVKHDPPARTFFLDFIDVDGCICHVWDGPSYAAAVTKWRIDGILVDDQVSDIGGAA